MSYLDLVQRLETQQAAYREALRRWWSDPDDTEAYQQVNRLLDDLGMGPADIIREDEWGANFDVARKPGTLDRS